MADKNFLYILKEEDTDFYRIGITHSIKYRIGILSGGNHRKLNLVYGIEFTSPEYALKAENTLHEMLREFTTDPKKRSWYELTGKRYSLVQDIIEMFVDDGIKEKFVLLD
jgi:predicted GIY-YIG superfamily endonuclease